MARFNTPRRLQLHAAECSAVCVGIILQYFGYQYSAKQLRESCDIGRDGATVGQIQHGITKLGHQIEVSRKGIEVLRKSQQPVILHWKQHHFVVFEGIDEKHVYINDPALGHCRLSIEEFKKNYTGICLEIICKKKQKIKTKLKDSFLLTYCFELFSSSAGKKILVTNYTPSFILILLYLHFMAFFDSAIEHKQQQLGFALALSSCLFLALYLYLETNRQEINLKFVFELAQKQQQKLLAKISGQGDHLHGFYSYELSSRIEGFAVFFKNAALFCLSLCFELPVAVLLILCIASINPVIAFFTILPISLAIAVDFFIQRKQSLLLAKQENYAGAIDQITRQNLHHYQTAYAMGLNEQFEFNTIPAYLQSQLGEYQRARYTLLATSLLKTTEKIQFPILLFLAGYQVLFTKQSFGQVLLIAICALYCQHLCSYLWKQALCYRESKTVLTEVDSLLPHEQSNLALPLDPQALALACSELGLYSPSSRQWVFSRVDIMLNQGEWLCISGESGSGKTTLLQLLSLQKKATKGDIFYFGVNAKKAKKPGFVFSHQQALFGSLYDYFTMDNEQNNSLFIEKVTQALEHVFLEKKLEYYLSHPFCQSFAKLTLNKAEAQQLAIAKAYLFNPKLLFIDEAFSQIEEALARAILNNFKKNLTTLVLVAHREDIKQQCQHHINLTG